MELRLKPNSRREEKTYSVEYYFPAINIPLDVGNKNDAMYHGHKMFTDWFEKEIPSISLSRFCHHFYIKTVVYETMVNTETGVEHENVVSINEEEI